MSDSDKIRTLLTSAGILMEDASARVILDPPNVAVAIALLRDVAHDLGVIAAAIDVIDRQQRLHR